MYYARGSGVLDICLCLFGETDPQENPETRCGMGTWCRVAESPNAPAVPPLLGRVGPVLLRGGTAGSPFLPQTVPSSSTCLLGAGFENACQTTGFSPACCLFYLFSSSQPEVQALRSHVPEPWQHKQRGLGGGREPLCSSTHPRQTLWDPGIGPGEEAAPFVSLVNPLVSAPQSSL